MLQKHQKWDLCHLSSILLIPNHYFKVTILMSFLPYRQKISTPLCNFLPQLLGLVVHNKLSSSMPLIPMALPSTLPVSLSWTTNILTTYFSFFLVCFCLFAWIKERGMSFIFMCISEQKEFEHFPQLLFCLFRFTKTTARKEFIQLPIGTF